MYFTRDLLYPNIQNLLHFIYRFNAFRIPIPKQFLLDFSATLRSLQCIKILHTVLFIGN